MSLRSASTFGLVDQGIALALLHEDWRENPAARLQHPAEGDRHRRLVVREPRHSQEVDRRADEVRLVQLVLLALRTAVRVVGLLDDRLVHLMVIADGVVGILAALPSLLVW